MRHFNKVSKLPNQLALLISVLVLSSVAVAQDHSGHVQSPSEDEKENSVHAESQLHAGHEVGNTPVTPSESRQMESMSMEMTQEAGSEGARDPHAYSGGYTRSAGPYSLPEAEQLHLADEEILRGVWIDRLETRQGDAEDFQELAGRVWLGNSYQRVMLRTELEWRDQTIEESKTELLYTRALSPFWNLEVGGRIDHGDKEHREWFAFGVAGLAPYWFELSATAYVSPEGHSAATLEGEYDLYLGQRLILQPRMELDFYGDSDLEAGHGKGLSKSLMGFRLRYDYDRQFSPYVGYERVHRHGETAGVFEPFGQHRENQLIAGFRLWF